MLPAPTGRRGRHIYTELALVPKYADLMFQSWLAPLRNAGVPVLKCPSCSPLTHREGPLNDFHDTRRSPADIVALRDLAAGGRSHFRSDVRSPQGHQRLRSIDHVSASSTKAGVSSPLEGSNIENGRLPFFLNQRRKRSRAIGAPERDAS
jgi:hypothetical protein